MTEITTMTTIDLHQSATALERFAALPDAVASCHDLLRQQAGELSALRASNEGLEHALERLASELAGRISSACEDLSSEQFQRATVNPAMRQLVPIIDVARSVEDSVMNRSELEAVVLESRERCLSLLTLLGVDVLEARVGDDFDPSTMRPVQQSRTDDPACHKTVACVLRPGFRFGGTVLRAQDVALFVNPSER